MMLKNFSDFAGYNNGMCVVIKKTPVFLRDAH